MSRRTYVDKNTGIEYPLYEAPYDYTATVYKADKRKAIPESPDHCLIALGFQRDKAVEAAFIGSGKDAYIIFKKTKLKPAHALHFTVNAQAGRVRDYFDTHKDVATQVIKLSRPTAGRTLAYRSRLNKRRAKAIKAGAEVKKRGKNVTRVMRLGVHHRPRAIIQKGMVTVGPPPQVAA